MSGARPPAAGLIVIAVFGVALGLGVTEVGLRATGFHYLPFPVVQFGWPDAKALEEGYQSDPDLLWVTRDYREHLDASRREPPAVVFTGDSCTQFGTYPARTLALLATERPPLAHGVKLAVGGWTAVQGSWQLTRDVLPLHPRVVTIYYGWNDHWMALGPPDAQVKRARTLTWLSDHVRLVQLLFKVRAGLAAREDVVPNRVDIATYEATLERMVSQIHAAGAQAVLITAGANHHAGGEPEYLQVRHLRHLADLIPVHQAYVEATRRAAHRSGAVLCDAAAYFAAHDDIRSHAFRHDGIHLTEVGDRELAALLARSIEEAEDSRARLR